MKYYHIQHQQEINGVEIQGILDYQSQDLSLDGIYLIATNYLLKLHGDENGVSLSKESEIFDTIDSITSDEWDQIVRLPQLHTRSQVISENNLVTITITTTYEIDGAKKFFRLGDDLIILNNSPVGEEDYVLDESQSHGIITWIDQWINFQFSDEDRDQYKQTQEMNKYVQGKGFGHSDEITCVGVTSKSLRVADTRRLNDYLLTEILRNKLNTIEQVV